MKSRRVHHLWVLFRPSTDVAGDWVAHCLDLDVVTQGRSLRHAVEMVLEAVVLTVEADVAAKLDPFRRGARTPQENRAELEHLLHGGSLDPLETIEATEGVSLVALPLELYMMADAKPAVRRARADAGFSAHAE